MASLNSSGGGPTVSSTEPDGAQNGDLWINTADSPLSLYVYDEPSSTFVPPQPAETAVQETEPTDPYTGLIWIDVSKAVPGYNYYTGSGFVTLNEGLPDADGYIFDGDGYADSWVEGYTDNGGTVNIGTTIDLFAENPDGNGYATAVLDGPADWSPYNTIEITWENTGASSTTNYSYIDFVADPSDKDEIKYIEQRKDTFGQTTDTVDISGDYYSESGYIRLRAFDDGSFSANASDLTVYNVRFLK